MVVEENEKFNVPQSPGPGLEGFYVASLAYRCSTKITSRQMGADPEGKVLYMKGSMGLKSGA